MSNLVNIVSPHQRSRLLCLPILLVLLFLRSLAMTWSRVTHHNNRNGLQQLFSNEQNQGFPRTQKRHTLRCALLGLDRPVMEFGQEVSVDQRTAWSGRFPCTQVTPSEKSWVFFWWFPLHGSLHGNGGGKEALRFIGFKKTWTMGRSPVSPPMVLNFKTRTWTPSELWLGMRCQVRELWSFPDLMLETVPK